jgi:hypothetical protein
MMTTYERGRLQGGRDVALLVLETKFGPLSAEAKRRLEELSLDELRQLLLDFVDGRSLKELRLED